MHPFGLDLREFPVPVPACCRPMTRGTLARPPIAHLTEIGRRTPRVLHWRGDYFRRRSVRARSGPDAEFLRARSRVSAVALPQGSARSRWRKFRQRIRAPGMYFRCDEGLRITFGAADGRADSGVRDCRGGGKAQRSTKTSSPSCLPVRIARVNEGEAYVSMDQPQRRCYCNWVSLTCLRG